MEIKIKRFDKTLPLPDKREGAVCFDLSCRSEMVIEPRSISIMPVNVAIEVPEGHALLVFLRSSMPFRKQLMLANGTGVVDPYYSGDTDELIVELFNFTDQPVTVLKGEKIAQCMFVKNEPVTWNEVEHMDEPGRGGYRL